MTPLCDTTWQYEQLRGEIDAAVANVLASGRYILGPQTRAFESEMADYLGCNHTAGVNSGTDALHLALRALGIGPGDEVITTPFSFIATSEAIRLVGATPVFADIDPETFNLDPDRVEAAVTSRTKAILPVHLYGRPCDMNAMMEIARRHTLRVVEDCAQALGATLDGKSVGTFGDFGCLSFFPTKNLGGMGDGGMVVTDDAELYERVEMLRRHGGRVKYHHSDLGLNSRLDELQAAILRVKLPHLEAWNTLRREAAHRYADTLDGLPGVRLPTATDADHVFHQYTIRVDDRDRLAAALKDAGVGSAVYYPTPLHLQDVHRDLGYASGSMPHAEHAARQCLSLPMFPGITGEQIDRVAAVVRSASTVGSTRHAA